MKAFVATSIALIGFALMVGGFSSPAVAGTDTSSNDMMMGYGSQDVITRTPDTYGTLEGDQSLGSDSGDAAIPDSGYGATDDRSFKSDDESLKSNSDDQSLSPNNEGTAAVPGSEENMSTAPDNRYGFQDNELQHEFQRYGSSEIGAGYLNG